MSRFDFVGTELLHSRFRHRNTLDLCSEVCVVLAAVGVCLCVSERNYVFMLNKDL